RPVENATRFVVADLFRIDHEVKRDEVLSRQVRQPLHQREEALLLVGMYDAFRKLPELCDVLRPRERTRPERMRVGHRDLVADARAVLQGDDHPAPERFFLGIMAVITFAPADIFDRGYLAPERHGLRPRGAIRRVGLLVMPAAI